MKVIHLIAILTAVLFILAYKYLLVPALAKGEKKSPEALCVGQKAFFLVIAAAFLLRIILAMFNRGHETDMNCFIGWAEMVYENGFSGFYTSEAFTDYPPGYMYILYIIGALRSIFNLEANGTLSIVLTKMPAILCDLGAGFLIYKAALRKLDQKTALVLCTVFLFNPAILLNSSIWGQVDAVFTLCIMAMCYFVAEKKLPLAYFAFGAGILIKPQTLIFTPVLIYGIINQVFLQEYHIKKFFYQLGMGLLAILAMTALALPFGLSHVISQYTQTLGSYPHATINGYNFWAMLGLNWSSQDGQLLFLTYSQWGTVFICLIVLFATYIFFRNRKDPSSYFISGAFLVFGVFLLSVRMHERYMFPALALLLLAFAYRPRKENFYLYILLSVLHFYNTIHVYLYYDNKNFSAKAPVPIIIGTAGMIVFALFVYWLLKTPVNREADREEIVKKLPAEKELIKDIKRSVLFEKINRKDLLIIAVIMLVYSGIALFDLGDKEAPVTSLELRETGESIVLDLGEDKDIREISFFLGSFENRKFSLEMSSQPDSGYYNAAELTMSDVFAWGNQETAAFGRYLRLTLLSEKASLLELVITDSTGTVCVPLNSGDYAALFDEQALYPERSTFRDSTYFDEIYHARTAYEYIHGLYSYENTHPPLGKIFISLGIRLFGMNPFGWRIIGTLFGIGMVPLIYLFARRLLKKTWLAAFTCVLFTFDFMHFTQTRIATIDVYVTFFILLMYYFMYRYACTSFYDTPLKKTWIFLGLSGIFMGLGIACKWTGIYAGAGLAVIFFWSIWQRYQEYRYALSKPGGETNGISHEDVIRYFKSNTIKTMGFCIIFFVVIPATIYLASYIPFVNGSEDGFLQALVKNQSSMLNYHSGVTADHPYSSWWYQWPVMYRPMWYYSGQVSDTISEGISAFGNPLVWWTGIPAFAYVLYLAVKKRDRTAAFLCISYLAQYMPWFLVSRITFIYHYFPSVPFVVLMIGYALYRLVLRYPVLKKAAFAYGLCTIALFFLFYPVLSGQPVNKEFVFTFLRWFKSWVLVV